MTKAARTSVIDYYAMPKPAYYALRRAAQGAGRLYIYDFKADCVLKEISGFDYNIAENAAGKAFFANMTRLRAV